MDKLLEALARSLNVSVDGISDLLSSVKDNTPQLYEQLVREWTYYTVLGRASLFMLLIMFLLMVTTGIVRFSCEVDIDSIDTRDVPDSMSYLQYTRMLTKENVKKASKTFKVLYVSIGASMLLSIGLNLAKFILAPNYSFLINEILPKLVNK